MSWDTTGTTAVYSNVVRYYSPMYDTSATTCAGSNVFTYVVASGASAFVEVFLDDTGYVAVIAGPNGGADFYTGTWTPVSGATHKVHVTISALNVPALYIDNVSIPLVFGGSGQSVIGGLANCVAVYSTATGVPGPTASSITKFFVTPGVLPNSTVFCC